MLTPFSLYYYDLFSDAFFLLYAQKILAKYPADLAKEFTLCSF